MLIGQTKSANKKKILAFQFFDQLKTMNRIMNMNDRQIDYVVYKSLLFVMRGCGKTLNNSTAGGSHYNVSYNYLPPGLREMEAKKYTAESDTFVSSSTSEMELSEDPMNLIIDPNAMKSSKSEVMPKRKYFTVSLSLEWVMFRGKAQVYEICVQGQDMTTLELFIVPHALMKESVLMESLGFTLNKNLNKYFFVHPRTGCVNAMYMNNAMDKMVEFLESKRAAGNENKNNGLILLTKNQEHLAALLDLIPPDLTLNTIKGFGLLNSICELFETQLKEVGNEHCYTSIVHVPKDKRNEQIISKSKADLLLKALEVGLQVSNPGYDSFIQPFCFPSDGTKIKGLKSKNKQVEAMYDLELFIASELKANKLEIFLEGLYCPSHNDIRPKSDVVAHRFCEALVDANLNFDVLKEKHSLNPTFHLTISSIILNRMAEPQRLKVLNQTHACLNFVKQYLQTCAK